MGKIIRLTESDLSKIVRRIIKEQLDSDYQTQIQDLENITSSPAGQKAASSYRRGQRELENKKKEEERKKKEDDEKQKRELLRMVARKTTLKDLLMKMGFVEGWENTLNSKFKLDERKLDDLKKFSENSPVYVLNNKDSLLIVWERGKNTAIYRRTNTSDGENNLLPRQKYGEVRLSCRLGGYKLSYAGLVRQYTTDCVKEDILQVMYSPQELKKM
jgi:hypothetical protein